MSPLRNLRKLNLLTPIFKTTNILSLVIYVLCYCSAHTLPEMEDQITSWISFSTDIILNLSKFLTLTHALSIHILTILVSFSLSSWFSIKSNSTTMRYTFLRPFHFPLQQHSVSYLCNASEIAFSTTLTSCIWCSCGNDQ